MSPEDGCKKCVQEEVKLFLLLLQYTCRFSTGRCAFAKKTEPIVVQTNFKFGMFDGIQVFIFYSQKPPTDPYSESVYSSPHYHALF